MALVTDQLVTEVPLGEALFAEVPEHTLQALTAGTSGGHNGGNKTTGGKWGKQEHQGERPLAMKAMLKRQVAVQALQSSRSQGLSQLGSKALRHQP